eukprot:m.41162 g.41162  ORF g.41162 m.41162 type:complete len:107 (-) comp11971_c0_seq1:228-548(-)
MAADNSKREQEFVVLISSDGFEYYVPKKYALEAETIRSMLDGAGQFVENERNEIVFRDIPSHIMERVCVFLHYRARYHNPTSEVPEFAIQPEIALELLMAANFLDV